MKKVGDLFAELGFRADASDSVKRAFVENLVRAANESSRARGSQPPQLEPQLPLQDSQEKLAQQAAPSESASSNSKSRSNKNKKSESSQQLSFDFGSDSTSPLITFVAESKSQRRSS